ncbi:MAG TPA: murein L,D-transpeptidase catalytic domain family protein [Gemmatimonadaceae bacterium]|jgi:hypothetical protein
MRFPKYLPNVLIGATAVVLVGSRFVPGANQPGPVVTAATSFITGDKSHETSAVASEGTGAVSLLTQTALAAFTGSVTKLSHPQALEDAFKSYFAYKTVHPDEIKKPYLYFVDYGLASTEPRGYVFDMSTLKVIDGPFTVAHGRGSSASQYGVPTMFSNTSNSHMTSLGLYVTRDTYGFHGHASGVAYSSIGLQLQGVSTGFNDNAANRRVVAHGAPYVTPTKAGRSEGCPAMEPARAQRLLPELADGAMVFLFAPNQNWLANDPWVNGSAS